MTKTSRARCMVEFKQKAVRLVDNGQSIAAVARTKDETIAWLLWYNKARLHSTLAYVSPMQFEQTWLQARQANS